MNIKQLYEKYHIPPNLQKHMLRVSALAQIIAENWNGRRLNNNAIALAGAFHDMANIIKFDFNKPSLFKDEEKQVEYWKQIKKEMIIKYGKNIHRTTLKIGKEIGLSKNVLSLIENLEWDNTQKVLGKKNFESAILIYSDMRIGPFGILSLDERIDNLQTRNQSYDFNFIKKAAGRLEQALQKHSLINLKTISDSTINSRSNVLLKTRIF